MIDLFPEKRALVVASKKDTRGKETTGDINDPEIYDFTNGSCSPDLNNVITSHSSLFKGIPNGVRCLIRSLRLEQVNVADYDIIAIEEGQFFDDLAEIVQYWVDGLDKHVLLSALDTNWKREIFGQVHFCESIATEAYKLTANCKYCIRELGTNVNMESLPIASFTARKCDSLEEVLPGGSDEYEATCRKHHPYSRKISEKIIAEHSS